jgi:hypothetical protein
LNNPVNVYVYFTRNIITPGILRASSEKRRLHVREMVKISLKIANPKERAIPVRNIEVANYAVNFPFQDLSLFRQMVVWLVCFEALLLLGSATGDSVVDQVGPKELDGWNEASLLNRRLGDSPAQVRSPPANVILRGEHVYGERISNYVSISDTSTRVVSINADTGSPVRERRGINFTKGQIEIIVTFAVMTVLVIVLGAVLTIWCSRRNTLKRVDIEQAILSNSSEDLSKESL